MICWAMIPLCAATLVGSGPSVDFNSEIGPVRPLHQAGQPPMPMGEIGWGEKMFHYLPEAGIRYSRLHDTGGAYGGGKFVDITNLFRDFDADETKPENYDFTFTDLLLEKMATNGIAPFFRLGETIENHAHIRRYRTFVPRDMEKWARICEHVIAHYTEGWANGYHYKIDYWEIWNEPDLTSEPWNPMWSGNCEDLLRLYEVTARHLKNRFPNIKIGGYGSCGFLAVTSDEKAKRDGKDARTAERKAQEEYHVGFFRRFMARVKERRIPLDFFTFHSYSPVADIIRQAEWCGEEMAKFGFGDVELNLDEWLPAPDHGKLGTARQAAEIAAVMAGLSRTRLGMAMIYDARCGIGNYSPLFNPLTYKPFPAYSVFKFYEELYRAGTRVKVEDDPANGLYAVAATDGKGAGWFLLSNIGENPHALPKLTAGWQAVGCRVIDASRTDVEIAVPETIAPNQVLLVACAVASPPTGRGVLMLTFDDANYDRWVEVMPLFAKYGAHASFFPNGPLDAHALMQLKKLKDAGHTVGVHTLHHADAVAAVEKGQDVDYVANEVKPQLAAYAEIGHTVRAMAYPNNRRNDATDALLAESCGIRRFRAGHVVRYDPQGKYPRPDLVYSEEAFFPAAELSRKTVFAGIGLGEAYRTDIDEIIACVKRVAKRNEVLVTFSHDIRLNAKTINMKTEWLERILSEAHACGLRIIGFDEVEGL